MVVRAGKHRVYLLRHLDQSPLSFSSYLSLSPLKFNIYKSKLSLHLNFPQLPTILSISYRQETSELISNSVIYSFNGICFNHALFLLHTALRFVLSSLFPGPLPLCWHTLFQQTLNWPLAFYILLILFSLHITAKSPPPSCTGHVSPYSELAVASSSLLSTNVYWILTMNSWVYRVKTSSRSLWYNYRNYIGTKFLKIWN